MPAPHCHNGSCRYIGALCCSNGYTFTSSVESQVPTSSTLSKKRHLQSKTNLLKYFSYNDFLDLSSIDTHFCTKLMRKTNKNFIHAILWGRIFHMFTKLWILSMYYKHWVVVFSVSYQKSIWPKKWILRLTVF